MKGERKLIHAQGWISLDWCLLLLCLCAFQGIKNTRGVCKIYFISIAYPPTQCKRKRKRKCTRDTRQVGMFTMHATCPEGTLTVLPGDYYRVRRRVLPAWPYSLQHVLLFHLKNCQSRTSQTTESEKQIKMWLMILKKFHSIFSIYSHVYLYSKIYFNPLAKFTHSKFAQKKIFL